MACVVSAHVMAETPLWLRDVAISPDGKSIAFTYKGDIYSVAPSGGEARQLTSDKAFDSKPVWTPDSRKIVFRSDREGSDDIFIMNANGGEWSGLPLQAWLSSRLPSSTTRHFSFQPM